ncbi:MAG: tetratricopeptide repeat protein [Helicobacteraceae bacterium]|nr:tetratricopeptide repeat protein [Helicobacteraceae bacterium]
MADNTQNTNTDDDKTIIRLDDGNSNKLSNLKDKARLIFAKQKQNISSFIPKVASFIGAIKNNAILQKILGNKKLFYVIVGFIVGIIVLIIIAVLILNKEASLSQIYAPKSKTNISKNDGTQFQSINGSELQNWIEKASMLYNSGQITAALDIYSNIAVFSQSFASFNLGVAKLKEGEYKDSINAFINTINSGENIAAAAINAALASYMINDLRSYDYFVGLAKGRLDDWYDKPLYSYLYSLVNFYSQNYFNTLSSLKNPSSNFYKDENSILASKIYLSFNDNYNALKSLLDVSSGDYRFATGLLYARMGEYDLAYEQIEAYIRDNVINNPKEKMALGLIELKRSNFTQVSNIYEDLLKSHSQDDLQKIYPIKVKLSDSLFDVNLVQKNFWNLTLRQNIMINYRVLFYFAPFRVFDVDNVLSLIREGGLELRMDNIEKANSVLLRGEMLSRINTNIAQSIREILRYNINNALEIMKQASLVYPNHQVLQYNLGLIYAQLNDFENAKKHFTKAYHLDENDVLSGIFALMCHQLTYSDGNRILNDITYSFDNIHFDDVDKMMFLRSLFGFVNGNISGDMTWFDNAKKTPMMYVLNALYSINSKNREIISNSFKDLEIATNGDMVAIMLHRISNYYNQNIKEFSLNLFNFFKNDLKNLDLVYTGPSLARQVYTFMAFLVGANSYVDTLLTNKLLNTQGDVSGILQALALNAIYLGDFEKSFVYYNSLIDDYKITTSENYFLAGVAAIGAGHYDNAVALIQLSRLESSSNFESRYALGLLHQAMGNFKLASVQFAQIGDIDFASRFFDFEIDTSNLLKQE